MKKILSLLSLTSFLFIHSEPIFAYTAPELESRVGEAKIVLDEVMTTPDQSIPEELLAKCKAIAIYPRVYKGAFLIGARYGRGVVSKRDENTGAWGPVAFSTIGGGSFGFQIGGQATDLILVIMNERGLKSLLSDNFTLGADAAVAAGPVGRFTSMNTDLKLKAGILSYSRNRGIFAGVALDGAVLTQDNNSNAVYYGKPVSSKDILLGDAVDIQPSSNELVSALNQYSLRWASRPKTVGEKMDQASAADYEGEIKSIDFTAEEIVVLDMSPMEKRPRGSAAEKRIKVDRVTLMTLKTGDHVKVDLDIQGKENTANRVIKI